MTGMLASVNCLEEAKLVLAEKIDVIDLKAPDRGALGGLPVDLIIEIVKFVDGRCPISATIGDLPMQPNLIAMAVKEVASTDVDFIKIGFFPDGDAIAVIDELASITAAHKLIAVLFADANPDFRLIEALSTTGFSGVMLDTLDKSKGPLTAAMSISRIGSFVSEVKSNQLICGLAGSLRMADIPVLLPFRPTYLGFRGALCEQFERTGRLDCRAVQRVKKAIDRYSC